MPPTPPHSVFSFLRSSAGRGLVLTGVRSNAGPPALRPALRRRARARSHHVAPRLSRTVASLCCLHAGPVELRRRPLLWAAAVEHRMTPSPLSTDLLSLGASPRRPIFPGTLLPRLTVSSRPSHPSCCSAAGPWPRRAVVRPKQTAASAHPLLSFISSFVSAAQGVSSPARLSACPARWPLGQIRPKAGLSFIFSRFC
jgi:hypothetical protein